VPRTTAGGSLSHELPSEVVRATRRCRRKPESRAGEPVVCRARIHGERETWEAVALPCAVERELWEEDKRARHRDGWPVFLEADVFECPSP
jgi:hypothetical protein